ncbi:neuronal membrane glycoprotein M6-b-like [Ylistrum balloti]|uniref:neuronal membrane glycoprotein M6-b-like n=1 Tax=Ylistrum balloti TaxID=509963 RepID=UPI002905D0CD|nr:neuronal membrane glycoprotein M6-b-like [Ylistrum balloti]
MEAEPGVLEGTETVVEVAPQEELHEPEPEPVQEPVPEPQLEPLPEPIPEPVPEPVPECVQETEPECVPEPIQEPIPEPCVQQQTEEQVTEEPVPVKAGNGDAANIVSNDISEQNQLEIEKVELVESEVVDLETVEEDDKTSGLCVASQCARNDKCSDRLLHCLSQVPCASLIAWIILLMGLGGLTGSLLIGVQKTRDLFDSDQWFWFIEYTLTGVVVGMFLIGTALLCVGHISTDPTSRHLFHTTKRNTCGQGLNMFLLVISYILGFAWTVVTSILAIPLFLLLVLILIKNKVNCIDLINYGLSEMELCGEDLDDFARKGQDLLISYIVAYVSSVLIVISLIHFMIVISANISHLKDHRLATLNAYSETTEEVRNSKHSIVDTTM